MIRGEIRRNGALLVAIYWLELGGVVLGLMIVAGCVTVDCSSQVDQRYSKA